MAVRNSISSSSETSKVEEKKEPVRYEDIMKSAGEVIRSPMIPSPKERRAVVFGRLVRSRSAKERDEPQIAA